MTHANAPDSAPSDPTDFDPSDTYHLQHRQPGGLTDADHARIAAAYEAARVVASARCAIIPAETAAFSHRIDIQGVAKCRLTVD
jgi:hypothetical protein